MKSVHLKQAFAATATMLCASSACAADKLFAAPETAGATNTSTGGSLGQMTLALAVVLAAVFVAAWVIKQGRKLTAAKGTHGIEVVSQVALGSKERAVLLKVGDSHVLVGVAAGQVNALHVCAAPPEPIATVAAPGTEEPNSKAQTFQSILKRSLGLS